MILRLIRDFNAFQLSGSFNLETAHMEWQKCQEYRCQQVVEMRRIRGVKRTMEILASKLSTTQSQSRASTDNLVDTQTTL